MKGFVETPKPVVDRMVDKLFQDGPPASDAIILDPGCGKGAFIEGIKRWCEDQGNLLPRIVGIELDPEHARCARERFAAIDAVTIRHEDFLTKTQGRFDYVIGNPPYVPITELTDEEKETYGERFKTAKGRFDLYLLFYERALELLRDAGRLVFITPEKFQYVHTADALRRILSSNWVREIDLVDEETFEELVTYPTITTLEKTPAQDQGTRIVHRDGSKRTVRLAGNGDSWQPLFHDHDPPAFERTLSDLCTRISPGTATGADAIFVKPRHELPDELEPFAHPTIPGRAIKDPDQALDPEDVMLVPYDGEGELIPEDNLGPLGAYLNDQEVKDRLLERSCVERKPWYAFHETPPLGQMLKPKILCKDITQAPIFALDPSGDILPRHSVYYLVPKDPRILEDLHAYLNSKTARAWLEAHCQRAHKGYLRVQSTVLKRLPVPDRLAKQVPLQSRLEA